MSITRGALRTRIAERLGDITKLTATSNGTTTTITDAIRISGLIEGPTNRDIVFTDSSTDNFGLSRRIASANLSTGTLTFSPLIADATVVGETAEMYNFRGRGWRKEEYDDAIAQAQDDAWPLYKVVDGFGDEYDITTGAIAIPADTLTHITSVAYLDTAGFNQPIAPASSMWGQGWSVDPQQAVVNINPVTTVTNGLDILVYGFRQETAMTTDASTTNINPAWLIAHACEILCMGAVDRDSANYNLGMVFGQIAEKKKPSIRTRMPTGTVALIV